MVGSWEETTLSSEEIKPVAIVIIELCMCEDIGQSVSLVSHSGKINKHFKNFIATWWNGLEYTV